MSYWTNQYLSDFGVIASENISRETPAFNERSRLALQAFRTWARRVMPDSRLTSESKTSNHAIWKAYYKFLSTLLQKGVEYPPTGEISPRLQQVTELQRVQTIYEDLLLKTHPFPRANESNTVIEIWVEDAFRNWEVLSGPQWTDDDVGEGGCNKVSRDMLDILYKAATKSFHSTLILRRLFQVHKSLTDFDLAYKALDTYVELIKTAKTRSKKSGEPPGGLDSDDNILRTVAEAIEGLCCFGAPEQARKARDLCSLLQQWVDDVKPASSSEPQINGYTPESNNIDIQHRKVNSETLTISYRAVGIGVAHWARWTSINEDRSAIQAEAVRNLGRSLREDCSGAEKLRTVFALSLLLAETRDVDGAIQTVKTGLSNSRPMSPKNDVERKPSTIIQYERERKLIPLWHLLGLLLSARQDFTAASQSCEAAIEQFVDSKTLFGHRKKRQDPEINGEQEKSNNYVSRLSPKRGLVDDMDSRELERIIELRMTELALTEVSEGPEAAVNTSNELLSLFARLFSTLGVDEQDKEETEGLAPPKSSAGTMKSFRGSVFGRNKKQARLSVRQANLTDGSIAEESASGQNSKSPQPSNPTIQITNDDPTLIELPPPPKPSSIDTPLQPKAQPHKLHRREGSINKIIRQHSEHHKPHRPGTSTQGSSPRQSFETGHEEPLHLPNAAEVGVALSSDVPSDSPIIDHSKSQTSRQPLPPIAHNMPHTSAPPPPGHRDQPPSQDTRLPTLSPRTTRTHPAPRFPLASAQIHGLCLLIKIWLQIASLYCRAALFDDAREALDEAARHANRIESLVATVHGSSAAAFSERHWGAAKSSDEVHADVLAARGDLALARDEAHEAMGMYEQALGYFQDCPGAIVGLAGCLLDIYEMKIPAEKPATSELEAEVRAYREERSKEEKMLEDATAIDGQIRPGFAVTSSGFSVKSMSRPGTSRSESGLLFSPNVNNIKKSSTFTSGGETDELLRKTPANLNRIAARDRAYGLLSTLTKLGSGWDHAEAWFKLARAYELGGEVDKAKEVLWWCVELEDTRPVRRWESVGGRGGYVL
ncbi:MAG: hypothetical protein Q9227_006363 [Pyrenula ochraceoflavens]